MRFWDCSTSNLKTRRDINSRGTNGVLNAIFPFWLKCKALLRFHVMISLKTFTSKTKTMSSSFMKSIYIFNFFHHVRAVNQSKSKVWKGKILVPRELSLEISWVINVYFCSSSCHFDNNEYFQEYTWMYLQAAECCVVSALKSHQAESLFNLSRISRISLMFSEPKFKPFLNPFEVHFEWIFE